MGLSYSTRYDEMRARRSEVDHSLGMGEAPGSNPGESMNERHFAERVARLDLSQQVAITTLSTIELLRFLSGYSHP